MNGSQPGEHRLLFGASCTQSPSSKRQPLLFKGRSHTPSPRKLMSPLHVSITLLGVLAQARAHCRLFTLQLPQGAQSRASPAQAGTLHSGSQMSFPIHDSGQGQLAVWSQSPPSFWHAVLKHSAWQMPSPILAIGQPGEHASDISQLGPEKLASHTHCLSAMVPAANSGVASVLSKINSMLAAWHVPR